jgi:hypothetical protein
MAETSVSPNVCIVCELPIMVGDICGNCAGDPASVLMAMRRRQSRAIDKSIAGVLPPKETVNHPKHYNAHPSGVECITIVEHFNFNVGNAIKYLWRADEKGHELEDLKKALWYCQREIERRSR